jgi:curved DNA-binding protein CbpA
LPGFRPVLIPEGAMESGITWYEILGVLPRAEAEKIRRTYDARMSLLRGPMISGAPSNVLVVIDRAQKFLDTAWEILGDPASRSRYDELSGVRRIGGGLIPSGSFGTGSWVRPAAPAAPVTAADRGGNALGALLQLGDYLEPQRRPARRVPVPDIRGLFYDVCMEVVGRLGLKVRSVQLTPHPMAVDGLVVDQSPRAPGKLRRHETLTAQVWHPPIRFQGPAR